MDVCFAGSIRGATFEGKEACYQAIIAAIKELDTLVSEHTAVTGQAEQLSDADIYQRDLDWISDSDVLIAEVSSPSHGVGFEIAFALCINDFDMPVLCLHKNGVNVSAMLKGCSDVVVQGYDTPEQAAAITRSFLQFETLKRLDLNAGL